MYICRILYIYILYIFCIYILYINIFYIYILYIHQQNVVKAGVLLEKSFVCELKERSKKTPLFSFYWSVHDNCFEFHNFFVRHRFSHIISRYGFQWGLIHVLPAPFQPFELNVTFTCPTGIEKITQIEDSLKLIEKYRFHVEPCGI